MTLSFPTSRIDSFLLKPRVKEDMTTPPSSSGDSGTEDSASECKSDQSLSTGYYPTENTFSFGEMASCEESASVDSSLHLLPPNQGSWGTGSVRRLFQKQDQMEEDREQFCKLSISLAWDSNVSSDQADPLANPDLNGHWQWMERWPKDRTKLTPCKLDNLVQKLETFLEKGSQYDSPLRPESTQKEDVHLTSVPPPHTTWVRHEKSGICQDLPKHKTPKNKDSCQAPENPPRLQEDEVMVSTEMPPRRAGEGLGKRGSTAEPHYLSWGDWREGGAAGKTPRSMEGEMRVGTARGTTAMSIWLCCVYVNRSSALLWLGHLGHMSLGSLEEIAKPTDADATCS